MSPAHTSGSGIDFDKLVRRIVLDVNLLRWFAVSGRGLAAIAAIVAARTETTTKEEARVLDFLERHVIGDTPQQPTNPEGDDVS
jgi:hypothetical protein